MKRVFVLSAVAVTCLVLSGCDAGCDFRNITSGVNNGPEDRCQERKGLQSIGFSATCDGLGAKSIPGGCDKTGAVFGCDLGQGVTDWYYPPKTRDNAASECGKDPIVDPP
jgi:hypothetical protein